MEVWVCLDFAVVLCRGFDFAMLRRRQLSELKRIIADMQTRKCRAEVNVEYLKNVVVSEPACFRRFFPPRR